MIDITARIDNWSTDPPTEDGWYWAYDDERNWLDMVYCLVPASGDDIYQIWRDGYSYDLSDFTHWLGPLPLPEPPR